MSIDQRSAAAKQIPDLVGEAFVRGHFEDVDRSFETAAWSRTTKTHVGSFPLLRHVDEHGDLSFVADIPAVCTASFFPSLFGGVMMGSRGVDEDVGQLHRVRRCFLPTTVPVYYQEWSHPSDPIVIRVSPLAVPAILEYGRTAIHTYMESLTHYHSAMATNCPTTYPKSEHERVGMIAYCAERLAGWARMCERLPRHADWFAEHIPEHPAEAAWQIPTS